MADNRVVIKINYDKDKARNRGVEPRMVTVWHTQRILAAVAILLLTGLLIFLQLTAENSEEIKPVANVVDDAAVITQTQIKEPDSPVVNPVKPISINTKDNLVVKRPDAIILDKRVVRAMLSAAPVNDEPGEAIKSPVAVELNQNLDLFYFVQIKNVKNSILFHRWYKDGQLVNKKQFSVKTNNARLISSHKITAKDIGQWQVVLLDRKGKVLSEVNYSVNP